MISNVPMIVYDNMDYIFTWNAGRYIEVYEGTMTDDSDRAASTPLDTIDLTNDSLSRDRYSVPATLAMFGDLCDQWTADREREDIEPEATA